MLVEVDDLRHHFPGQEDLFAGLCASFRPGVVSAITGPSGSGKSTLLGVLAGWIQPTSGHVRVVDVARVNWVFQNPHGVAGRTALDHVALPFVGRGASHHEARASARALLAEVNLDEVAGRRFRDLSGGEAQRLMLARALASQPDLLLVDEPTAQLDPRTAHDVIDVLGSLSRRACIVVIATHDERVTAACDRQVRLGNP